MKNLSAAMLLMFASVAVATAQNTPADYAEVLKTLGKQGDFKSGVLKVNIPRGDLKVTIDGIATPTPFGFGGWLAIQRYGRQRCDDGRFGAVRGRSEPRNVGTALQWPGSDGTPQPFLFRESAHLL